MTVVANLSVPTPSFMGTGIVPVGVSQPATCSEDTMMIDCDTCSARGLACGDCVVTVLIGAPPDLNGTEQAALAVLAGSGLVPPLRLEPGEEPRFKVS